MGHGTCYLKEKGKNQTWFYLNHLYKLSGSRYYIRISFS